MTASFRGEASNNPMHATVADPKCMKLCISDAKDISKYPLSAWRNTASNKPDYYSHHHNEILNKIFIRFLSEAKSKTDILNLF